MKGDRHFDYGQSMNTKETFSSLLLSFSYFYGKEKEKYAILRQGARGGDLILHVPLLLMYFTDPALIIESFS